MSSSWWDRYLAPGDIRAARQQQHPSPSPPTTIQEHPRPTPNIPNRISSAHRARRQNALLFGGLAFTFLSVFITRRALTRKQRITSIYPHLAAKPPAVKDPKNLTATEKLDVPHFTPSVNQARAEGGLDALEALFLATLNVGAIFMTGLGAAAKFLDIADVEDVRNLVRQGVGYDVYGGEAESAADKEMEEWVAGVLAKRDEEGGGNGWDLQGFQGAIAGKLKELEEIDKRSSEKKT